MPDAVTIVGGSVACLVAALTAARRGRRVRLYVDPARMGGSFAGVAANGRRFDLGSRLLELDYEDAEPRHIAAFDPTRGSHRPVIAAVAAFIGEMLRDELRPAAIPELWIEGRRIRCPLMTVDLSDLAAALPDRAAIREQARICRAAPPDAPLGQASLAQHGARLHERLIAPICAKQDAGWAEVPATARRKLWAALFHPETVFQAFAGRPVAFRPHRPFTTTASHQTHPFVGALVAAVRAERRVDVVGAGPLTRLETKPGGTVALQFGTACVEAPGPACAIGVAPGELFRAAGIPWRPDRMTASILWLDTADHSVRHAASALMIADPAIPVLRISLAGSADGRTAFAAEFGCAPPCPAAAADALRRTGLVTEDALLRPLHRIAGPAQPAPTWANADAFRHAVARLAHLNVTFLAAARRFGFDSLNDQIADGLHFGAMRC